LCWAKLNQIEDNRILIMHKTLAIFNNCTPVTREDDPQEAPRFKQYRGADFGQEALTRGLTSIKLTCKSDDCKHGKTFEMPATDQVFALHTFGRRGTEMPKWCPGCRIDRKARFWNSRKK